MESKLYNASIKHYNFMQELDSFTLSIRLNKGSQLYIVNLARYSNNSTYCNNVILGFYKELAQAESLYNQIILGLK